MIKSNYFQKSAEEEEEEGEVEEEEGSRIHLLGRDKGIRGCRGLAFRGIPMDPRETRGGFSRDGQGGKGGGLIFEGSLPTFIFHCCHYLTADCDFIVVSCHSIIWLMRDKGI